MYRFFADPARIGEKQISITGSDVNHIKNVLREKVGNEINICEIEKEQEFKSFILSRL